MNRSKGIKAPPVRGSSTCTTVLPPPQTTQPQRLTDQGSNVRKLWVRNTDSKLKTLGLIHTSGQFLFVPGLEGKSVGHFWGGRFEQRDAKAGFSRDFVMDLETSRCSMLVFVQTSPFQATPWLLRAGSYPHTWGSRHPLFGFVIPSIRIFVRR